MKNADMPAMPGRVITNGESFVENFRPGAQAVSAGGGKAQPVAGLRIAGWMLERDGDESFPRLHKSESEASQWVKASIGSASPVTMRPVYAIDPSSSDPVRAALVEALKEAREVIKEFGDYAPEYDIRRDLVKIDAALKAAGEGL